MKRAAQLQFRLPFLPTDSFRQADRAAKVGEVARSPLVLIVAMVATAAMSLAGCAAPVVPVMNVVVDGDVRGCDDSISDSLGPLDVAIVIDTSQSTGRPTGFDIDRDGIVRPYQRISSLDRGDSRLAAEIAAVRPLVRNAENRDIRFSLVTFAGPSVEKTVGRSQLSGSIRDSQVRVPLTFDTVRLEAALAGIQKRGSEGRTIFAAGMQRGTRALVASRTGVRRRIMLLMSDSARPNSLDAGGTIEDLDPRMMSAAMIARHNDVVIHTFGLSPKAGLWRREAIGQIAGATGGTYHPIDDPGELYCHLVDALRPTNWRRETGWRVAFARYREQEAAASNGAGQPEK